ncbi:MAG: SWIM zinc finger family protein [Muribaculaceae bacterium]|nr:SWIM zinc finger family protein [Muribaculaceae bacterium]
MSSCNCPMDKIPCRHRSFYLTNSCNA